MNHTISLALFLAVLSLACGDSANSGGKCRVGESIACTCDDGRSGAGVCGEDACDCPPTYALRAEPGSLALGEVAPGTTREGQLTIHNPAFREVRLRSVAVSPLGEGFDPVPQAPQAIPAGGSVVVTVRFTAATPGTAVARLRVEPDDADVAPVEVSVTALVPGPLLSCGPATVSVASTWLGETSTAAVVCTNAGIAGTADEARLVLDRLEVEGAGFSAAWREAPPAAGLAVGEAVTIDVGFTPAEAGHHAGTLSIGGAGQLVKLVLSGVGAAMPACDLEFSPDQLLLSGVEPNSTATVEIGLYNRRSDAPCTVARIGLCEGTDPAFSLPGAPIGPVVIPGGGQLRIPLLFAPGEGSCSDPEGAGCVEFELSPAPEETRTIPLFCSLDEGPSILPLPGQVDFGELQVGCETSDVTVELLNLTTTPATLAGVEVDDGGSDEFFVRSFPYPGTVVAGGLRTFVTVAYRPEDAGVDRSTLFVRFEELDEPIAVPLRGEAGFGPPRRDTFEQPIPPKLDVLVVLDNGTSMAEESPWIRQELADFPSRLLAYGDAQLAVTTTGLVAGGPGCPGGVNGGEDGRFFPVDGSRPRILDRNTPNLRSVWEANLAVGTCHAAPPQGLEAALRALTPPLSSSADDPRHPEAADGNLGFLRPDARLWVLVVSDRADASPGTDDAYYQAFVALKNGDWSRFNFSAVSGARDKGCNANGRSAEEGDRLIDFVQRTRSGAWDSICGDHLSVDDVAVVPGFGPKSCFHLTSGPEDLDGDGLISAEDGELRVWVDEVELPELSAGGPWWYELQQNAVCFSPAHIPPPGSTVEVEYPVACLGW